MFGFIVIIFLLFFILGTISEVNKLRRIKEANNEYEKIRENFYGNSIFREHYANLEKMEIMYKTLYHSSAFNSPLADELINLCERDISIAPLFKQLHVQYNQDLPGYPAYKRLAMVYEKRGEYKKAADVCCQAIHQGFIEDGTSGKMYARLAKLIKKGNLDVAYNNYLPQ